MVDLVKPSQYVLFTRGFEVAHIALSTFAFHRLTRHTFYASPSRREPPRPETACLRPTSRLMEGSFHAKSSASESAFRNICRVWGSYAPFRLPQHFSKPIHVDLPISHAGAFKYWVEYSGSNGERITGREGFFNIDPILKSKARSPILSDDLKILPPGEGAILSDKLVNVPLDGLAILTVVSKWMGPTEQWRPHFKEAKDRGYTMLHYTPLQQRGESDSPYSIRSQLDYDRTLFGTVVDQEEGRMRIEEVLTIARDEYGLLSLTDVVLNHTANDTPWLVDHPEAGFSPANTPHLTPAFELDSAIIDFSGSLAAKGLPTSVQSENDVNVLIAAFDKAVRSLNLWQYYVLDSAREKDSVNAALAAGNIEPWTGPNIRGRNVGDLADILRAEKKIIGFGQLASRHNVRVDGTVAAGFVQAAFADIKDHDALANAWVKVVDVLNVPLYAEWEADTEAAIGNVRNRLRYTRLDANGPRLGEITKQ